MRLDQQDAGPLKTRAITQWRRGDLGASDAIRRIVRQIMMQRKRAQLQPEKRNGWQLPSDCGRVWVPDLEQQDQLGNRFAVFRLQRKGARKFQAKDGKVEMQSR